VVVGGTKTVVVETSPDDGSGGTVVGEPTVAGVVVLGMDRLVTDASSGES
jgi:hypothetical protein